MHLFRNVNDNSSASSALMNAFSGKNEYNDADHVNQAIPRRFIKLLVPKTRAISTTTATATTTATTCTSTSTSTTNPSSHTILLRTTNPRTNTTNTSTTAATEQCMRTKYIGKYALSYQDTHFLLV